MKFCGQCAAELENRCPGCGFQNPEGFRFCGECATPLSGDSSTNTAAPKPEGALTAQPPPSGISPTDDPEQAALEVAKEWARSSVDTVSQILGQAVTSGTPILQQVAGSVIHSQIRNKLEWTFSAPVRSLTEGYEIVATAVVPLQVKMPGLRWSAIISADCRLSIDAREKRLLQWKMAPQSFKLSSSEGEGNGIDLQDLQKRGRDLLEKSSGGLKLLSEEGRQMAEEWGRQAKEKAEAFHRKSREETARLRQRAGKELDKAKGRLRNFFKK